MCRREGGKKAATGDNYAGLRDGGYSVAEWRKTSGITDSVGGYCAEKRV